MKFGNLPLFPLSIPVARSSPYASLPALREAIRSRRKVRFRDDKDTVVLEPHLLWNHPVTGAFRLFGWVESGDAACPAGWTSFQYHKLRQLEILPETFAFRSDARLTPRGLRRPREG